MLGYTRYKLIKKCSVDELIYRFFLFPVSKMYRIGSREEKSFYLKSFQLVNRLFVTLFLVTVTTPNRSPPEGDQKWIPDIESHQGQRRLLQVNIPPVSDLISSAIYV